MRPSEDEIKKIMAETGMDYLQAYRHVQQRIYLATQKNPYPLGKSAHFA
jgi:hypothetical protein